MNIKCIALDLDRTTLNAHGHLSEGNYNALCNAIENSAEYRCGSRFLFRFCAKTLRWIPI